MSSFTLYPTSALELRPVHQNQEKIVVSKEDVEDITESVVPQRDDRQPEYLTGTRFWVIVAVVAISLFITNLEIPIVTTSTIAITNQFGRFDNIDWVNSSYLLGYVAVLVIIAKLSDLFGRKFMLILSLITFIVFSAACGASQSLAQLIVLRAFQGIGGSGCFAISTVLLLELVPPQTYAKLVTNMSAVYALSLLLGPILGGLLSEKANWRWVFLINIPIAVPAVVCLILAMPQNFPYHGQSNDRTKKNTFGKETFQRVDLVGATLLLLATLSLTAGFEEAGSQFHWGSAYVIALLIVSGVLWICLLLWERRLTLQDTTVEPVFPWRFVKNREMLSLMLNAFFLSGPWFVAIFQLPQRFQLIHGSSATMAGVQTIPFTFAAPFGSVLASALAKKAKVPVVYMVLSAGVLQTLGFALLATLPSSTHLPARIYGFQFIAGFRCGINIPFLLVLVPFVVEQRDNAIAIGAVSQIRLISATIVLAIVTSVFNSYADPRLSGYLAGTGMRSIKSAGSLVTFPESAQERICHILAHGYNLQMVVLCVVAAGQIPASLLLWQKVQIML